MNEIGIFTGTCDDVLDRHEQSNYTPTSYPNFSDKQWDDIWRVHEEYLRDKMIQEQLQQVERMRQDALRIEVIGKVHYLLTLVLDNKIAESIERRKQQRTFLHGVALNRSGNAPKARDQFIALSYQLESEPGEYLVFLYYAILCIKKGKSKKSQKQSQDIENILVGILSRKGIATDQESIARSYNSLPEATRKEYAKRSKQFYRN